jgi:hypothetical protein
MFSPRQPTGGQKLINDPDTARDKKIQFFKFQFLNQIFSGDVSG